VKRAEHSADLGSSVRTYASSGNQRIISVLALLLGLFAIMAGVVAFADVMEHWTFGELGFITVGALFLIYYWWRNGKTEVRAYEKGIVYIAKGSVRVFRWANINEVYQRSVRWRIAFVPIRIVHRYVLNTTDGRVLLDGSIRNVGDLGQYVQEQTVATKMPFAIEMHNAGKILRFGQLALQRQHGIWHGKSFIRWQDVKSVDVGNGCIRILKYGKWFAWAKVSVAYVPNYLMFLALLRRPQAFLVS